MTGFAGRCNFDTLDWIQLAREYFETVRHFTYVKNIDIHQIIALRKSIILRACAYETLEDAKTFMGTESVGNVLPNDIPMISPKMPNDISDVYGNSDYLNVHMNVESQLK